MMNTLTTIGVIAMIGFFVGIPFIAAISAGLAHGKNQKEKVLKVIGYIAVIIVLIAMGTIFELYSSNLSSCNGIFDFVCIFTGVSK